MAVTLCYIRNLIFHTSCLQAAVKLQFPKGVGGKGIEAARQTWCNLCHLRWYLVYARLSKKTYTYSLVMTNRRRQGGIRTRPNFAYSLNAISLKKQAHIVTICNLWMGILYHQSISFADLLGKLEDFRVEIIFSEFLRMTLTCCCLWHHD